MTSDVFRLCMAVWAAMLLWPLFGCAETRTAVCADGTRCPLGLQCAYSDRDLAWTCISEPNQCGNGLVEGSEVCDDRNNVSGDGCTSDCRSNETCGNGITDSEAGEECDDGNQESGDGCSDTCLVEPCGNGVLDVGELCDKSSPSLEEDCADAGFDLGHLTCSSTCDYDESECRELGWTHMPAILWKEIAPGGDGMPRDLREVGILDRTQGARRIIAVGDRGTLVRFDGMAWRQETLPPAAVQANFAGLAAVSESDIFVVGSVLPPRQKGIILHFNGTDWRELEAPSTAVLAGVWANEEVVFAAGARAAGDGFEGVVLRLDRATGTWASEVPAGSSGATITDVFAIDPCDAYAVTTGGEILHRDCLSPEGFRLMAQATDAALTSIWGSESGNIYAAGSGNDVFHYDGTLWYRILGFPSSDAFVHDITGNGPDDIYMVRDDGVILHFDGEFWQIMNNPPVSAFFGVDSQGPENVVVVGSRGAALMLLGWYTTTTDAIELNGIVGMSSDAEGDFAIYATTSSGLLHSTGSDWQEVPGVPDYELIGIWIAPGGQVVAVGNTTNGPMGPGPGVAVKGSLEMGVRGVAPPPEGLLPLSGVWGTSADDWFAVGAMGSIWRYRQDTWIRMNTPGNNNLGAIWGSGPDNVFAVGDGGAIWHYNGNAQDEWTAITTEASWRLSDVWGSGPSDVFVVGDRDIILHYDGSTWTSAVTNAGNSLLAVWGYGPNDVYAVGGNGAVAHYNGTKWARINRQTPARLSGVWGPRSSLIFFVDSQGNVHKLDRASLPGAMMMQ